VSNIRKVSPPKGYQYKPEPPVPIYAWRVPSFTDPRVDYTVTYHVSERASGNGWACDCPDFDARGEYRNCKHIKSLMNRWGSRCRPLDAHFCDYEGCICLCHTFAAPQPQRPQPSRAALELVRSYEP
jgi:hypothetical protein